MFGGFPFGLMFLNFVGMVLFFIVIVMAVKLIVRGARANDGNGSGGQWGGPLGCRGRHGKHGGNGRHWRGGEHWGDPGEGRHEGGDQALEQANLRLARGEISTEQYLELRSALAQAPSTGGAAGEGDGGDHGNHHGGNHGLHPKGRRGASALGIARLRLASGEIGVDEFNALRSALGA